MSWRSLACRVQSNAFPTAARSHPGAALVRRPLPQFLIDVHKEYLHER